MSRRMSEGQLTCSGVDIRIDLSDEHGVEQRNVVRVKNYRSSPG